MAVFKIDVQKSMGPEFWTNRYFVDAPDLGTAHSTATDIIAVIEQDIHNDTVLINKVRTSTLAPNDGLFLITVLDLEGTYGSDDVLMPLFNVLRVDLTIGLGRPGRKYYRLAWGTNRVVADFNWNGTDVSAVTAAIDTMRTNADGAGTPICNEAGDLWVDAAGFHPIAMRQLRRGSRQRTEPII